VPDDEPQHARLSDEKIRAVTVGPVTPLNAQIQLVEYDPTWPALFEREAARIRTILGSRALAIEHIGSTAIPGLLAKPIIDMLLVVADSSDETTYIAALTGYVLRIREPDWHKHRLLKGPDTNINLHVFSAGCPEIARHIVFRDWLRQNEADRALYARTKRELAAREWRYMQNYADAKTTVVEGILGRALKARPA
jgi:GrpB-like predicted nucleotidyltransferase (UPF0157 family)